MECPDDNAVSALLDGRLSSQEVLRLDEHAATCAACRALLAEVARELAPPNVPRSIGSEPTLLDADVLAGATRELADPRIGRVLGGKWTIERLLGEGGMARVYEARHRNGRAVAIKVLRPELAVEPKLLPRFFQEGHVANRIAHSGVVSILDDGTEDGAPYLVMELLEGESLGARVKREGPLPETEVLAVTRDLLDVLAAAHDKGVVHRDLKPDNLFWTKTGELKVLDFGIARFRESARNGTESGVSMGTPAFMPPEQARGRWDEVDARSDLWAVGATMYALLTGAPPRRAETTNEELLLAMTVPVAPIRERRPDVSTAVAAIVDRALALDPALRWQDARAMLAAVREAKAGGVSAVGASADAREAGKPRRPTALAAMLAAAIVLGGGALCVVRRAPAIAPVAAAASSGGEPGTTIHPAPEESSAHAQTAPPPVTETSPAPPGSGSAGNAPQEAKPNRRRDRAPAPAAPRAGAASSEPAPAPAAAPIPASSRDVYDRRH